MEWMRCNGCWIKVGKAKEYLFHLTQCGHLYCDKCIMNAEKKCVQCGSVGMISLPLKEPLSPQIAHYFTRSTDLLDKVIQAEQFQESQLALCLKRADASDSKYESLKQAYWVSSENLKKVLQKYSKLKMNYNMLEKEMQNSVVSSKIHTPSHFRTPPSSQANNIKSSQHGYYPHKVVDSIKRNSEVFRVPSITRVPRSAGYYTASSASTSSSTFRGTPSQSNYSRY